MPSEVDQHVESYLAEMWEQSPTVATSLGIDGFDDRLPDLSAQGFARRQLQEDVWFDLFHGIPDDGLTLDERIDRDLVLSNARGGQVMRDWQVWRRDPATYLGPCLSGVFSLFLQRLHSDADLVRFASARLRLVPEVLAAGRANLDPALASQLAVERSLGQCGAGVSYARNLVPAEVPEGPLRDELAAAGAVAADAFEEFAGFLRALAAEAEGEWAIGESRYSALLREKELLGYGAKEMHERGRAAFAELDAQLTDVAKQVGQDDGDWRVAVKRLNEEHPRSPEEMRAAYEEWTEKARQFLVERELVTLPEGERCLVVPSPPFQRPVLAVASYGAPPAFKPSLTGHFFVPFPPDGASDDEIQKRLETNSFGEIPTVSVHEAYPGHHWHLTWMQQNRRPIRNVIRTAYFTEGWGLYAERLFHEQGFFEEPKHVLYHLKDRIFRAARIIVDTALHCGDMTFDEAVGFMRANAGLSEPTAKAEVGRYCSWPTQASSYLTGSLEIERIRQAYLDAGKGTLRQFNDTIAGSGGLPIALAEKAVMEG